MTLRSACKAGSWYAASPSHLGREVDRYLAAAEPKRDAPPVLGGIVPHAGLAFSGPVAAHVYARILRTVRPPEAFLLFGAVHTARLRRPALWARGAWETPFGPLQIHEPLAARLLTTGLMEEDETPHQDDNALELQMPFLARAFPEVPILPIAIPPEKGAPAFGAALFSALDGAQVVVLGSSDLTHYGAAFGWTPAGVGEAAVTFTRARDAELLGAIVRLDAEAILPLATRDHSACGAGAIAATVAFARAAGSPGGEILAQTTSHEIAPDGPARHFVGYGAVVFPSPLGQKD